MKKDDSVKSEYNEILNFIAELEEECLTSSDLILANKKELQYKKRQKELLIEEQDKKRNPNISMFSPLRSEDVFEIDTISVKEEMEVLEEQIQEADRIWKKEKQKLLHLQQLKKYLKESDRTIESNVNELKNYSVKLLETQELDRNRISRDLHDSTVQSLTSLVHKIEYCSKMIDIDPVCAKLELQSMIELNKAIINDMREIIYDLRPMSLNNLGFIATIESHCLHLQRNGKMDVNLSVEGKEKKLPSIVCVTLYRILQEACNNAMKHSEAKHLWIRVVYKKDKMELCIEDDGKGFDINTTASDDELSGFGLSTMKERANLMNGTFSMSSKIDIGTKIQVVVPIIYNDTEDIMK